MDSILASGTAILEGQVLLFRWMRTLLGVKESSRPLSCSRIMRVEFAKLSKDVAKSDKKPLRYRLSR